MTQTVFVVQHLHVLPQGTEDVKLIGVYATRASALASVRRLAVMPGFCDHPSIVDPEQSPSDAEGFYVDEYLVDQDHWSEGYFTDDGCMQPGGT